MTNRIRNELNDEIAKRQALINEIQSLKLQLEESKAGLLAAARISDQLEIAQVTNSTIKEECKYFNQHHKPNLIIVHNFFFFNFMRKFN